MLFKECGHYSGECPCLTCNEECAACNAVSKMVESVVKYI